MANNLLRKLSNWLIVGGAIAGAWILYSKLIIDHKMPIGPAIDATRNEFHGTNSVFLSYYSNTQNQGRPVVLLHSINAAANAYEMKPLFEHYQAKRPVYALDLPGFGFSERTERDYSVELYLAAIKDFLSEVVGEKSDIVALSLSCEFAAQVVLESPNLVHSLTLISPTGFSQSHAISHESNQRSSNILRWFSSNLVGQSLYDLLVTKLSLRYFLKQNFASAVDEGLLNYHYRSSHQPDARFAPMAFVSGKLFTPSIFDMTYSKLSVPTLVIYDKDPNTNFDLLPQILERNVNWRARRILNTRGLPHFERLGMTTEALDIFWSDVEGN